jgi:hypothetical protein
MTDARIDLDDLEDALNSDRDVVLPVEDLLSLVKAAQAYQNATFHMSEILATLEVLCPDEMSVKFTHGEFDADKSASWLHGQILDVLAETLNPFKDVSND